MGVKLYQASLEVQLHQFHLSDCPEFQWKRCNKVIDGNTALRAEYKFKQYKIDFSQENLDILLTKYWNDVESWGGEVNLEELTIP